MKRPLIAALGFLLVAVATPAMAGWPDQPIRIVVPYPAGGAVDAMLRVMAPKMSEKLGQPIVVDNRAGANANLCSATIWMGTQRQSGWPFRRSRREDDCRGATITQAIFA